MGTLYPHLLSLIEEASDRLPAVSKRLMFGCEALFADHSIYALVWKTGRIGVRLPDAARFAELMAVDGAEQWSPGKNMTMSHWVLVPESFHDDTDSLGEWVRRAYQFAMDNPPRLKKKPAAAKAKAKTKTVKKKVAAKGKKK
jgi:TfoX/Sxy family transcriptional regulator of competence genes